MMALHIEEALAEEMTRRAAAFCWQRPESTRPHLAMSICRSRYQR
jgi:hypothetical protein